MNGRNALVVGASALAGAVGVAVALIISGDAAPIDTCNTAIAELKQAKRIIGPGPSYAKDNPNEWVAVQAYWNGGPRPNVSGYTHMGLGLVAVKDTCLALGQTTTTTTTTEPPPTTTEPPPPTGALRDRPPGYPDYAGYLRVVNDCRLGYTWADTQDVLFTLGSCSYPEGIALVGGRNVVIIGGSITATGSNRGHGVGLAVWPRTEQSHYYIEGVRIKPIKVSGVWRRQLHDGIALRGPLGKLTIQNVLIGPVAVKEGYTDAAGHPDVFQIQGPAGGVQIRVDRFTGYTEYTGVMESEFIIERQDWSHVNLVATGYSASDLDPLALGSAHRGHTVFGMYGTAAGINLPNLTFTEFWWAKDPLQGFQGYTPIELVTQKGGKYGKPPEGDYVTEADLALPYVSPGYS